MLWRPTAVQMLPFLFLVVNVYSEDLPITANSSAIQDWSEWSNWTTCSLHSDNSSCTQSRERRCKGECEGERNQIQSCSGCDIPPSWSVWSDWTECSYLSSMCFKTRNRTCTSNNSTDCAGSASESADCHITLCKNVDQWGTWSRFSECKFYSENRECKRTRTRVCEKASIPSDESVCQGTTQQTNNNSCQHKECGSEIEYWSSWSPWSICRPREENCIKSQARQCMKPAVHTNVSLCEGNKVKEADCDRSDCRPRFVDDRAQVMMIDYGDSFTVYCNLRKSIDNIEYNPTRAKTAVPLGLTLISWKRNGDSIDIPRTDTDDVLTFTVTYMTNYKEGIYVCCAESFFGQACSLDVSVKLNSHGPVVPPTDMLQTKDIAKEGTIDLYCDVKGYELSYKWYFKASSEDSSITLIELANTKYYKIESFSHSQAGRYWCCCSSKQGYHVNEICLQGYDVAIASNDRTKYLIAICVVGSVIIFILALILFCYHSNKMNGFKRRFNHVFNRNQSKIYNNNVMYSINDEPIQRSHSYIKRLSKSRPLSKKQLEELISLLTELTANGEYADSPELSMEYESVPTNMITITKTPVGTENKNRYLNVLPNPHTRVEIAELEGDPTTTYINANYVRGYKLAPAIYIATQGPIHSTIGDFWRLIWEQKSRVIVMTTGIMENSRIKCSPYWPTTDDDEPFRIGTFTVELKGMFPSKYFTLSILAVTCTQEEEETRIIYHFWYHSWPDFGVPEDTGPFLDFVEYVRSFSNQVELNQEDKPPTTIHCSAGIGRTGTFVAVNLGIEQLNDEGVVDPLGYLCQLRQDRGGMIQTLDQYTFIHRALYAYQSRNTLNKSTDEYSVQFGLPTLEQNDPLLPEGCEIPIVLQPENSKVDDEFMRRVTRTIAACTYRDSITSINNPRESSVECLPLLNSSAASSKESLKKTKRSSKVKSLFFPLSPKGTFKRLGSMGSGSSDGLKAQARSLSLSDVKFAKVNKGGSGEES